MTLVVPDVGGIQLLQKMLQTALSVDENYILKLYNSAITPANSTTSGTFTG